MSEIDPVGLPFRVAMHSVLNETILEAARELWHSLPPVPSGDLTRIYLHWSVQGMCAVDAAYNIVITENDGHYAIAHSTDVRKNARSTFDDAGYAQHTWHRNTGAVGIALDGMDGPAVTPESFGADPVTVDGLVWLCAAAAAVAKAYAIDIAGLALDSDPFYGEIATLTHAEAGNLCGVPDAYEGTGPYGPTPGSNERWDLATFVPGEISQATATECGDALRFLAHRFKAAL